MEGEKVIKQKCGTDGKLCPVKAFFSRKPNQVQTMIDVLISLIPIVLFAIYKYHEAAFLKIFLSVLFSVLAEVVVVFGLTAPEKSATNFSEKFKSKTRRIKPINFLAPSITGLLFALMLPASISYFVVIFGSLIATLIGKMVFGGTNNNIFNPAMFGRIFVVFAFSKLVNSGYSNIPDLQTGATAIGFFKDNDLVKTLESFSFLDSFFGYNPGVMGEVNVFAILLGLGYLLIKKAIDYKLMLSVLVPIALFTLLVGVNKYGFTNDLGNYFLLYFLNGGTLFMITYIVTDPVTMPKNLGAKFIAGLVVALVAVIIRTYGGNIDTNLGIKMSQGLGFAVLFGNMVSPLLDRPKWLKKISWQFLIAYFIPLLGFSLIFALA